ncbi:PIG-L family deacetylase [Psychroflexus montanilacus]|uniref:PIG-L family deacetylase n=1 Tax=Psychroflexus montanilacus TaxID=2873598 RepID=UPI001CCEFD23|nr:PIG-L family deacetylase [Psychroflexus montanilacus]MBZ9651129.1 PIG-L family deacetylase [Psychroflexus montanilacus]
MTRCIGCILFFLITSIGLAQDPNKPSSSEIFQDIKALNFLGNVLYIAAHPDDENTSLITYFSKEVNAQTTYLSLTRGDGGQNLIGSELSEKLGMIRSQELLNARKIDGGNQFFSRAIDFGFSKTPEETLKIWDKEKILSDVVWAIRKHRPDVIINRFDHRTAGSTHGHHTSSAILSVEAFEMAGDEDKFSSQLDLVKPWQPKRAFFNTSWWFYGSEEAFENADKSNFIELEINKFYPLEGLSNNEISALSRSQHKSQGFGNTGSRGDKIEYIELIKGDKLQGNDPFAGVDTSWNRIPEGKAIGKILNKVEKNFDFKKPWKSVPKLLKAKSLIDEIDDEFWRTQKSEQIKSIIIASLGLFAEVKSKSPYASPGDQVQIEFEVINRSPEQIQLKSISQSGKSFDLKPTLLEDNMDFTLSSPLVVSSEESFTTPYWLQEQPELGIYKVDDRRLIGQPQSPNPVEFTFEFDIDGTPFEITKPLIYKYNDPVKGEVYQNFEILPEASISLKESVYVFKNSNKKQVEVDVKAFKNDLTGQLELNIPKGWEITPKYQDVQLKNRGETKSFTFEVIPTTEGEVTLSPILKIGNKTLSKKVSTIDYDHIGTHKLVQESTAKLVNLEIEISDKKIAYVEGAGSSVPSNLRDLGFEVDEFSPDDISTEILSGYDVVIMGIRAYNIHEVLAYKQDVLFQFVENGGTMIVQYNTNRGLKTERIAPFEMKMSRDRVTEEDAKVRFITPKHKVLYHPNKIVEEDFEGWVQERGLYFPEKWSRELSPVLSMNDKNETPKEGSILIGEYGKGHYIYTGLSFFRELPAGVSGAYKLFSNLISIE